MTLDDIPLALTGDKLIEAIRQSKYARKPLAEGFIYEKTCTLMSSDPGLGKSTLTAQIAVELAAGLPLFGYFSTVRPVKVFYIQAERDINETLERMEIIGKTLPLIKENIVITDAYQRLNLLNPTHVELFFKAIKRNCADPVLIIIDPIYSTISGGLSEDRVATALMKVMDLISKNFNCSLWLNHHTTKTRYGQDGLPIQKNDPFYGAQWIKSHVTGSYLLKQTDKGADLILKKDNYGLLTEKVPLEYNPETELCFVSFPEMSTMDKIKHFLKAKKSKKETFDFAELKAATLVCNKTLRTHLLHTEIKDLLKYEKTNKGKYIYEVKDAEI